MAISTRTCQITDLVLACMCWLWWWAPGVKEASLSKEPIWVPKGYRVRTVASNRQPGAWPSVLVHAQ